MKKLDLFFCFLCFLHILRKLEMQLRIEFRKYDLPITIKLDKDYSKVASTMVYPVALEMLTISIPS